jgi:tetratricopeptide (TPR) repeat protein
VERTLKQDDTSEEFSQKIEAITAGIVEMKTLDERWDGATYYIKAEMAVDPKDLERRIAEVLNDKQKTQELEEARKQRTALEAELQKLKQDLETTKDQALQPTYQAKAYELATKQKGDKAFEGQLYATAVANYQGAAKDNPNDAEMFFKLGVAYHNQTKYREAMEQLKISVRLNPNNADAHYYIALSAYALKQYDDMFIPLEKCMELQPKDKRCTCGLVYAHYAVHNQQLALRWCARAKKMKCDVGEKECHKMRHLEFVGDEVEIRRHWDMGIMVADIVQCGCFVSDL